MALKGSVGPDKACGGEGEPFRKGCNAELKLQAADDGVSLVVLSFSDQHNHPISRVSVGTSD